MYRTSVIYLWQYLATFFENNLILPALKPQTALIELWSENVNHDKPVIKNVLLIFKLPLYKLREKHRLNIVDLLTDKKEIKRTKYCLSSNWKKRKTYQNNKLHRTHDKLTMEKNNKWTYLEKVFFSVNIGEIFKFHFLNSTWKKGNHYDITRITVQHEKSVSQKRMMKIVQHGKRVTRNDCVLKKYNMKGVQNEKVQHGKGKTWKNSRRNKRKI